MFQALRIRDFRLLWGGGIVSSLGSWLLILAIPAHVFLVTGSLRDTGLTLAAEYLPLLVLSPVAGVFTDRWDRRRLMIATDLFRAGAVAVMLLGTSPGRYWVLYVALIAENSGFVLFTPALRARIPAIVGTGPLLSSANSLNSFSSGAVRLIGGPLGGILLTAFGVKWLICADAVSYLLSAAAVFLTSGPHDLDRRRRPGPDRGTGHPARPARRTGAPSRHGHLPRRQRVAQRHPHPVRDPAAGRQRADRVPAGRPGPGLPARRPAAPPAARPGPAQEPADGIPDRHGRRLLPALHLIVAEQRAARGSGRRHIRLDVRGGPADDPAAGDPERGARAGRRRLPDRRGSGHPPRRRRRALLRAGSGYLRRGYRRQPRHAERGGADVPHRAADARGRPCAGQYPGLELADVPDELAAVVPGAVPPLEAELRQHPEGRGVPGADRRPEPAATGGDRRGQHSGRCLGRVAVAVRAAQQLVGDLRLLQGGPAGNQAAVPDEIAPGPAADGQGGYAVIGGCGTPADDLAAGSVESRHRHAALADEPPVGGSIGLLPHVQDEPLGFQLERHGSKAARHRRDLLVRRWVVAGTASQPRMQRRLEGSATG